MSTKTRDPKCEWPGVVELTVSPPKIKGIRIIENPFDDIVPRITAAERREQMQARLEAKKEAERREKRAKAKKNTKLLSFGEAEEEDEETVIVKKKDMGRRDCELRSENGELTGSGCDCGCR